MTFHNGQKPQARGLVILTHGKPIVYTRRGCDQKWAPSNRYLLVEDNIMDSVERIVKAASSGSQIMVPEGVRGFVVVKRNNGTNVIELVLPKDSFKIDNFLRNHCDPEVYASLRREKRELDEWRGNEEDIDFGGSSPKPIDGNRTDLICSPRHIAFALDYMAKRPGSTVYQAARFLFDSFGVRVTVEQLENGIAAMNKSKDSGDSDKPKVEVPKVIETKESTIGIESEDHKDTVARLISGERARYSRGQQAETTTSADVVLVGEPPASSASGTTTAGGDLQLEPPKTEDLAIGTPAAIMKKRVIRIVQYRDEISEFIASRIAGGKACYTWDIAAMLLERHGIAIPAKNVSQTMAKWREEATHIKYLP